jgi:hypothetical protein
MPFTELSLAVVGARFANPRRKGQPTGDRQMEILLCEPGEAVTLKHEPTNKADQNAIAVYSAREVQIGYVSADRTLLVHRAWGEARAVRAVFQEATSWGCAIRVTFDGNEPVLPPPRSAEYGLEPMNDFSPDPEPEDDWEDWVPPDE